MALPLKADLLVDMYSLGPSSPLQYVRWMCSMPAPRGPGALYHMSPSFSWGFPLSVTRG